ncbi:LysR family transcriptional regulator [Streptomyces sp. NA02950]|uniref:LysR family transcriptional regulator n=1 Tax=Streptomyces sp. NA02950 TaxID=2742137 RepID=UPI0015909B92|nr:LysR family transcriptional regulator [Streptomyces sp. NA02950]QKV90973.1 LysR family transcriptional regulator [Streptomyces sp. NA02950]
MRVTQSKLDLNLVIALDALLEEESVSGAAQRLHLSSPAMSRTLARIRKALGDPVLVRSGRRMVPTPRALALREEVRQIVERAQAVFTPAGELELATLERTFTLLADDGLLTLIGMGLLERIRQEAPGVCLRLIPEGPGDSSVLRDGRADLELGVFHDPAPETRVEHLVTDDNTGVVRSGHPLLSGPVTPERYAAAHHLSASRRGRLHGPIDEGLSELGLRRRVVASVPTFASALLVTAHTDLVARSGKLLARPLVERLGLVMFEIPLELPKLPIGQAWHPRYDADPAHIWLRGCIREIAGTIGPGAVGPATFGSATGGR